MTSIQPSAPPQQQQPTEEEAAITQSLAQNRPTIDAAVKSFISLICARAITASATDDADVATPRKKAELFHNGVLIGLLPDNSSSPSPNGQTVQQQVLQVARAMLQAMNVYTFPVHCTVASSMGGKPGTDDEKKKELLELSIAAQLWNGLVQSDQKPPRFLGRRALKHAWKNNLKEDIDSKLQAQAQQQEQEQTPEEQQVIQQRQKDWLQQFESLLFHVQDPSSEQNDDSELIWNVDGGKMELAKRRERRQSAATKRGPSTPS
jgi:hypothetical protein